MVKISYFIVYMFWKNKEQNQGELKIEKFCKSELLWIF